MSIVNRVLLSLFLPLLFLGGCLHLDPGGSEGTQTSGLLSPRDPRWLGADGAISVDMGEGAILWLFGDTWLEPEPGKLAMVSNSLGIQENGCSEPFVPHWTHGPKAAFPLAEGQMWLWPGGGLVENGTLFLLFHRVERIGPSPWDFRVRGSEFLVIPNPRGPPGQWRWRSVPIPWARDDLLPGSSPLVHGSHLLFFATRPSTKGRELIVARIERSRMRQLDLEGGWEFFAGGERWSCNSAEAKALFDGVGTEFSMERDEVSGKWFCVYSPGGISQKIVLRSSSRLEGPWEDEKLIYTCPEGSTREFYCYGAKHHVICSDGWLWITYSVNSREGLFPGRDMAKPRWIRLPHPLRIM